MESSKSSHSASQIKGKKGERESHSSLAVSTPLTEVALAAGSAAIEGAQPEAKARNRARRSIIDRVLGWLSAVPLGVTLLALLIVACMIGMLIQQQELETFPSYYANLTPAEKLVYGRLGFFNIYHAWYFNLLLLLLSLNIILASIDHFPKAWSFLRRKKLTASPTFAQTQRVRVDPLEVRGIGTEELVTRASQAARALKFKVRVTPEDGRTTVFAERGAWNRLGAYAVHVGLLTIFLGGFLTSTRGFTGGMWLAPGESNDQMMQQVFNVDNATNQHAVGVQRLQLPFEVYCVDIQQKLIDKDKFIDAGNTLDWLTRVKIRDETGEREALVHLNKPLDYRGYRFFQASFQAVGNARTITLRVTPEAGRAPQEVTIKRNGEAALADGTRLRYLEFTPDFQVDRDNKIAPPSTGDYVNPAAHLEIIKPNGERSDAWAFTEKFLNAVANAPFMQSAIASRGGSQFILTDFEKVPQAHMLSIQYDPGANIVYLGFLLLCLTLIGVFFFSHQRLWIVIEDGKVYLGGDANRNRLAFEDRVKKIAAGIREPLAAA
jgi:cytochrome c biogenesis protein